MKRKIKRTTWSFSRMAPILQALVLLTGAVGLIGFGLMGGWFFWALVRM